MYFSNFAHVLSLTKLPKLNNHLLAPSPEDDERDISLVGIVLTANIFSDHFHVLFSFVVNLKHSRNIMLIREIYAPHANDSYRAKLHNVGAYVLSLVFWTLVAL